MIEIIEHVEYCGRIEDDDHKVVDQGFERVEITPVSRYVIGEGIEFGTITNENDLRACAEAKERALKRFPKTQGKCLGVFEWRFVYYKLYLTWSVDYKKAEEKSEIRSS